MKPRHSQISNKTHSAAHDVHPSVMRIIVAQANGVIISGGLPTGIKSEPVMKRYALLLEDNVLLLEICVLVLES